MKYSEKIKQIEQHLSEFGIELWEVNHCRFVDITNAQTAAMSQKEQPHNGKYFIATLEVAVPISQDK